ncbi:unnamed protein product (macronuclear) [Paramecium tetraurelia]|uniref:Uncharacterized protein n=1 Tax=Paramecium tetraurelia TaxID=5888 RepID=A0BP40_PARTE|nr:uncharacterized protein GSPATT00005056001 [Paramecium tetraurelia]CAK60307.1 unnamed protein product [Paramecium tetraurelia]|eukprot:XP_001427705.1 hypothetical protein (macronuclear) [Paramecium tetraurelia strain d4-2]
MQKANPIADNQAKNNNKDLIKSVELCNLEIEILKRCKQFIQIKIDELLFRFSNMFAVDPAEKINLQKIMINDFRRNTFQETKLYKYAQKTSEFQSYQNTFIINSKVSIKLMCTQIDSLFALQFYD